MQVRLVPGSSLVVTRNFSFDYDGKRNNLVLSLWRAPLIRVDPEICRHEPGGERLGPSQPAEPAGGGRPTPRRRTVCCPGSPASTPRTVTCASATSSTGWRALGCSGNLFRLVASNRIDASQIDHSGWDRVETPSSPGGDLRVASFNVLNFFTTVVGGDANPTGSNNQGALTVAGVRVAAHQDSQRHHPPQCRRGGADGDREQRLWRQLRHRQSGYGPQRRPAGRGGSLPLDLPRRMASPSAPTPSRWGSSTDPPR